MATGLLSGPSLCSDFCKYVLTCSQSGILSPPEWTNQGLFFSKVLINSLAVFIFIPIPCCSSRATIWSVSCNKELEVPMAWSFYLLQTKLTFGSLLRRSPNTFLSLRWLVSWNDPVRGSSLFWSQWNLHLMAPIVLRTGHRPGGFNKRHRLKSFVLRECRLLKVPGRYICSLSSW